MNHPINLKTTMLAVRNSISLATAGRSFIAVVFGLAWFALSPTARPADGDLGNGNTAEGLNALSKVDIRSALGNTAIGDSALFNNVTGGDNTATGYQALYHNITECCTLPGDNTADGYQALYSNTTGYVNTATGSGALFSNTTGSGNTANGGETLYNNTTGWGNTATGAGALYSNTTGIWNTATGGALGSNTTGNYNTATGVAALADNTTGHDNTATGLGALGTNITGSNNTATGSGALCGCVYEDLDTGNNNTATGFGALYGNVTGNNNTATGVDALENNGYGGNDNTATGVNALEYNYAGSNNTAQGAQALQNSTGSNNIALGANAGANLITGSNNIDIGARGVAHESNIIRIGTVGVQKSAYIQGISGTTVPSGVTVIVGPNGHLGTVQSSERFKDEIKPMDKASEAILALKPVTFRYKKEFDPESIPQFGLVAEQVEKVNPDLVVRDAEGKVYTVRYEAVNAMLLNEFLKEHRRVEEQEATIRRLASMVAEQQKVFTARLKEQDSKIQIVSDELEVSKTAPQLVVDNQ